MEMMRSDREEQLIADLVTQVVHSQIVKTIALRLCRREFQLLFGRGKRLLPPTIRGGKHLSLLHSHLHLQGSTATSVSKSVFSRHCKSHAQQQPVRAKKKKIIKKSNSDSLKSKWCHKELFRSSLELSQYLMGFWHKFLRHRHQQQQQKQQKQCSHLLQLFC